VPPRFEFEVKPRLAGLSAALQIAVGNQNRYMKMGSVGLGVRSARNRRLDATDGSGWNSQSKQRRPHMMKSDHLEISSLLGRNRPAIGR
jgi:hypothetical protein